MENKQSPSKKLLSIQEEKLIRQFDYDTFAGTTVSSRGPKKKLLLEIFNNNGPVSSSQRVLVSIKPRNQTIHHQDIIKTIFIAEKKRGSEKSSSRSRLGIGDHSSFDSSYYTYVSKNSNSSVSDREKDLKATTTSLIESGQISSTTDLDKSLNVSLSTKDILETVNESRAHIYNDKPRPVEKCYLYTQPQFTIHLPRDETKVEKSNTAPKKVDIGTLVITNTTSDDTAPVNINAITKLHQRIDKLEKKLIKQEMVFRSLDTNLQFSSSDEEECKESTRVDKSAALRRPGCSYIQQYSHIPETSAFHRYAQQSQPLSTSKTTSLEKEHNSEQYGRDFTTYDGITARARRQSASVPCKRNEFPKVTAERLHKIRHKLNPVRDYRLMDTVHYLAQGEFAPRDDGIKLTPSREAVLSDIIWEDVCRTHWPNTRLGRRNAQPERYNTRCELQRLIDSLLRERVAHVERRRRRHYRIVKLNHRHESCRPLGKTGDIIVASHKKKDGNPERNVPNSEHNAASAMMPNRRWEEQKHSSRKSHRSYDRMVYHDSHQHQKRRNKEDESTPGPSYASAHGTRNTEPMCCYRSVSPPTPILGTPPDLRLPHLTADLTSSSTLSKPPPIKSPRLVVKKEVSRSRRHKDEPNLEQYILLPTLVIRTPSNMKRQKKFNELYHRILNVNTTSAQACALEAENTKPNPNSDPNKKDIGFNINVTVSTSAE